MRPPLSRRIVGGWIAASALGFGCSLLQPYPGGEDPASVFLPANAPGIPDGQDPLINPTIDESITVESLLEVAVALPGVAFPVELSFDAPNMNVVGGGIRFPGSKEVQWTFTDGVMDLASGEIRFGYILGEDACDDVANLCHEIITEQFAVSDSFEISPPVEVPVVLQCATCESVSCIDVLPAGACKSCAQPDSCVSVFETCYADDPDHPSATVFDTFLGEAGALWSSAGTCAEGEALCDQLVEDGSCDI